jgi:hypothetical protein
LHKEEERVMAYFMYNSLGEALRGGPYPHKAGEFCGNVSLRNVAVLGDGNAVIMSPAALSPPNLLRGFENVKLRIGKPAEINSRPENPKFVTGLYLAEDLPLEEDAVEIDTDMFTEEVVSGNRLPQKPIDVSKIRRKEL